MAGGEHRVKPGRPSRPAIPAARAGRAVWWARRPVPSLTEGRRTRVRTVRIDDLPWDADPDRANAVPPLVRSDANSGARRFHRATPPPGRLGRPGVGRFRAGGGDGIGESRSPGSRPGHWPMVIRKPHSSACLGISASDERLFRVTPGVGFSGCPGTRRPAGRGAARSIAGESLGVIRSRDHPGRRGTLARAWRIGAANPRPIASADRAGQCPGQSRRPTGEGVSARHAEGASGGGRPSLSSSRERSTERRFTGAPRAVGDLTDTESARARRLRGRAPVQASPVPLAVLSSQRIPPATSRPGRLVPPRFRPGFRPVARLFTPPPHPKAPPPTRGDGARYRPVGLPKPPAPAASVPPPSPPACAGARGRSRPGAAARRPP